MLIGRSATVECDNSLATLVGLPIAFFGAWFAFRPPLRRDGIAISVAGSAIFLLSGLLLLAGLLGMLDIDAQWSTQLLRKIDQTWTTSFAGERVVSRDAVLESIAKALTLLTMTGIAYLVVRGASWLSHYQSDKAGRR